MAASDTGAESFVQALRAVDGATVYTTTVAERFQDPILFADQVFLDCYTHYLRLSAKDGSHLGVLPAPDGRGQESPEGSFIVGSRLLFREIWTDSLLVLDLARLDTPNWKQLSFPETFRAFSLYNDVVATSAQSRVAIYSLPHGLP